MKSLQHFGNVSIQNLLRTAKKPELFSYFFPLFLSDGKRNSVRILTFFPVLLIFGAAMGAPLEAWGLLPKAAGKQNRGLG